MRFPSFQTKSLFLHRTTIRDLRRGLTVSSSQGNEKTKGDGKVPRGRSSSKQANGTPAEALLPVFLERREIRSDPAVEEGKSAGKGPKKGGGKKAAAGKKGDAPETPPPPAEKPWRCQAFIDLSPLVQPDALSGGDCVGSGTAGHTSNPSSRAQSVVAKTNAGDSPLRAELRAPLVLNPPPMEDVAPVADAGGPSETNGEEATLAVTSTTEDAGVRMTG